LKPGSAASVRYKLVKLMDQQLANADEAISPIRDRASITLGEFWLWGIAENLIDILRRISTEQLTVISNNSGVDDFGISLLLQAKPLSTEVNWMGKLCGI
jgi:3-oxoacid CoA-transferase subunit A